MRYLTRLGGTYTAWTPVRGSVPGSCRMTPLAPDARSERHHARHGEDIPGEPDWSVTDGVKFRGKREPFATLA